MKVAVFVQTCPQRRTDRLPTIESLRQSDVGDDFTVLEHPEDQDRRAFFRHVLETMADCGADYALRLEDDAVVNQHVLHNFSTWSALDDPLFGAGWLFVPEAALSVHFKVSGGVKYRALSEMWAALAVAIPVKYVPACIEELERSEKLDQDLILSRAVWREGKRCFFHEPSLAENRDPPTAFGTKYLRGTTPKHLFAGRTFSADWKRPVTTTKDLSPSGIQAK